MDVNIQYESRGDILYVQFAGLLNAMDLIFLYLNQDYKSEQHQHTKILYDFTRTTGSELSNEDAQGVAMLRKRDQNQTSKKHLVIVRGVLEAGPVAEEFARIISGGNYQVDICASIAEAEALLAE